jgi:hypothetical protein
VTALEALAEAHRTGKLARPESWRPFEMGIGWYAEVDGWQVMMQAGALGDGGGTAAALPRPEELVEVWEVVERKGTT